MTKRKFPKAVRQLIRRVASSRSGQVLFALHLVLLVYAEALRKSSEPFHFLFQRIYMLDPSVPALLCGYLS